MKMKKRVETYVQKYEKILIFDLQENNNRFFFHGLISYITDFLNYQQLIICSKYISEIKNLRNMEFWSYQEMEEFVALYYTYEFSDRITLISDSGQYSGLLNYLLTGLLTEEEFCRALLY